MIAQAKMISDLQRQIESLKKKLENPLLIERERMKIQTEISGCEDQIRQIAIA